MAKKKNSIEKQKDERLTEEMPVENNGTIKDLLKENKPLYNGDSSLEEMSENNRKFYESAAKKAFRTAFKEEKEKLDELVNMKYYPEEQEQIYGDDEIMKSLMNVV
jgi:hypothetical protein